MPSDIYHLVLTSAAQLKTRMFGYFAHSMSSA